MSGPRRIALAFGCIGVTTGAFLLGVGGGLGGLETCEDGLDCLVWVYAGLLVGVVNGVIVLSACLLLWPRRPADAAQGRGGRRSWVALVALVLCCAVSLGGYVWVQDSLVDANEQVYAATEVPVLGPADPGAWRVDSVSAGPPRGHLPTSHLQYQLSEPGGRRVLVLVVSGESSQERQPDRRYVERDGATAEIQVLGGPVTDADLDVLAASFVVHDARWLARQQSWLYRRLA